MDGWTTSPSVRGSADRGCATAVDRALTGGGACLFETPSTAVLLELGLESGLEVELGFEPGLEAPDDTRGLVALVGMPPGISAPALTGSCMFRCILNPGLFYPLIPFPPAHHFTLLIGPCKQTQ